MELTYVAAESPRFERAHDQRAQLATLSDRYDVQNTLIDLEGRFQVQTRSEQTHVSATGGEDSRVSI